MLIKGAPGVNSKSNLCFYVQFLCCMQSQIAKFMGPTWGPPGSCRPQMGPMLAHEPCYQRYYAMIRPCWTMINKDISDISTFAMALFILLTQNAFVFESIPDIISLVIHLIYSCLLDQHSPMYIAKPARASLLLVNIIASCYIWMIMEIPEVLYMLFYGIIPMHWYFDHKLNHKLMWHCKLSDWFQTFSNKKSLNCFCRCMCRLHH